MSYTLANKSFTLSSSSFISDLSSSDACSITFSIATPVAKRGQPTTLCISSLNYIVSVAEVKTFLTLYP